MIKHNQFQQGSLEWMVARAGIPTASEFDNLLSPTWELRKGQMPQTYLNRKLAEWWAGGPISGFNSFDMEQGNILEEEAKPWFTLETGKEIEPVGFCTSDDGSIGASPDGLIGEDCGIEIKCPESPTHIGYLLNGELPKDYLAQVHGSMFVTGRPRWLFMSYRRRHPNLLICIERDEEIQEKIAEALALFLAKFQAGKERLIEINGGPPTRPPPLRPTPMDAEPEPALNLDDVPH